MKITDAATGKPLVGANLQGLNTGQPSGPSDSEGVIAVECEDPAPEGALVEAAGYESNEMYIQDEIRNSPDSPQPFSLKKDATGVGCGIGMLAATVVGAAVVARRL